MSREEKPDNGMLSRREILGAVAGAASIAALGTAASGQESKEGNGQADSSNAQQGQKLTDEEIKTHRELSRKAFDQALKEAIRINDLASSKTLTREAIEVETVALVASQFLQLYKLEQEKSSLKKMRRGDTGDQGANCNYNPFNKINVGDISD